MKRYGNLFEKVWEYENIKLAHKKAKKDKLFYKEVKIVDSNVSYYLSEIQSMLKNQTYTVKESDYKPFTKTDKGKEREIYKLDYFPHRIIQHALMNVIEDVFLSNFIDNTFASIPGRGIHQALNRIDRDLKNREETKYCFKMDIKKFYPSIDQQIAKDQLRSKFKDKKLLWLMDMIIESMEGNKGIAIGSLYSQWQGNFYLSSFDHWLKEVKKIKYYYRYCDDIVIFYKDKKFLHNLKLEVEQYLNSNLNLKIKGNWQIFPTFIRGVDFVGYRHFGDYILLRKSTAKSLKRKMTRLLKRCRSGKRMSYGEWCSVNSYSGWILYCNGENLSNTYIKPLIKYTNKYYKEVIQRESKRHSEKCKTR